MLFLVCWHFSRIQGPDGEIIEHRLPAEEVGAKAAAELLPTVAHCFLGGGAIDTGAIFDGFLEVFWIFLKNEHGKVKGTSNQAV